MKKLIPLFLLALVASVSMAQTTVTPHFDTVITTTTKVKYDTTISQTISLYKTVVSTAVKPYVAPPPTTTPTNAMQTSLPVNYSNKSNFTINNLSITGGTVPCITLTNCNGVHITANTLQNSTAVGIYLVNCYNVTIDYNYIANVSTGVYAAGSTLGGIVVNYNKFRNMQGPYPRGQFVQFNSISGPGLSISYNKCENIMGSSYPEDAISLYMSNGTAASPLKVVGNWIRGGGPSKTGGGICVGDNGGSYQYVANNILVNPGQYGIGITGGDNHSVINNQIFASQQSFTNVGIDIYTQKGNLTVFPTVTNATVSGNLVNFTNAAGQKNPNWIGPNDTIPTGWSNNTWNASITAAILPATF